MGRRACADRWKGPFPPFSDTELCNERTRPPPAPVRVRPSVRACDSCKCCLSERRGNTVNRPCSASEHRARLIFVATAPQGRYKIGLPFLITQIVRLSRTMKSNFESAVYFSSLSPLLASVRPSSAGPSSLAPTSRRAVPPLPPPPPPSPPTAAGGRRQQWPMFCVRPSNQRVRSPI